MGLWAYSIRELIRRPRRSILTLVGIAIGVATVAVSWSASHAAQQGYRDLFNQLAGSSNLELFAAGEMPFDAAIVGDLQRFSGVSGVQAVVQGMVSIEGANGPMPAVVIGGERSPDQIKVGELAMSEKFAESLGVKSRQRIRVWGPTGQSEWVVIVDNRLTNIDGSVSVHLASAQSFFGYGSKINRIRIRLDDSARRNDVEAAISRELPQGVSIRSPADRAEVASGLQSVATQGLIGLTTLAVVGAGYVVLNSMRMNLITRRREIALLRTLGATASQVEGTFIRQAFLLGVAGSLMGLCLGYIIVFVASIVVGSTSGLPMATVGIDREVTLLCLLLGVTISLISVWLPAKSYCQTAPLELFRNGTTAPIMKVWSRKTVFLSFTCCLLFSLGLSVVFVGGDFLSLKTRRYVFPPALALLLISLCVGLTPFFLPLLRTIGRPLETFGGVKGTLAVRLLSRRPERTMRTASVVLIGVALAVGFGHTVLNTLADVRNWCHRAIPADFLIRSSVPDPGFLMTTALPEPLESQFRQIDGVEQVDTIAFIPTLIVNEPALVLSRTFAATGDLPLDLRGADHDSIRRGLEKGGAVVADGLARTFHLQVGDSIEVETPKGSTSLRVVGTVTEYAGGGNALYVDRSTGHRLFGELGANLFLVTAKPGEVDRAGRLLKVLCAKQGLLVQENADLRGTVDRVLQTLTSSLWILLAVMFTVAGMGVWSVVAVTVREQERDAEILRAVGLAANDFRKVVALQSVLIAVCGMLPGLILGMVLSLILDRMLDTLWGYRIPFHIQWTLLAGVVGLTLAMGLTSSYGSSSASHSPSTN